MARDPLLVLHAVRRRAIEQARYALGHCLQAEAEVAERARLLDETRRRDREASGAWQDANQFLEMASIRAGAVRAERQAVAAEAVKVAIRSGEARGAVTAARMAAEAVEQLINETAAAARATAATREQHVLDDIARLRRGGATAPSGHAGRVREPVADGIAEPAGAGPEPPIGRMLRSSE